MKGLAIFVAGVLAGALALVLLVFGGRHWVTVAPTVVEAPAAVPGAPDTAVGMMPSAAAAAPPEAAPLPVAATPSEAAALPVAATPADAAPLPASTPPAPGETQMPSPAGGDSLLPPEPEPVAPASLPLTATALIVPVEGILPAQLADTFTDARGEGRSHDAIDIMAPTGTPVRAVADGRIVKLFNSVPGGLTVYHFDASSTVAYYYAHLDRYAEGLVEGQAVKQGDLIGYVGYSGNASPEAPHLHFAIFVLGPEKNWWQGTAVNPYPALGGR